MPDIKDGGNCIIVKQKSSVDYILNEDSVPPGAKVVIKFEEGYSIIYDFICDPNNPEVETKVAYTSNNQTFDIKMKSHYGCLTDTSPTIFSYITEFLQAFGLFVIGITFCIFGLKIYKEHMSILAISIAIIVGGFIFSSYINAHHNSGDNYIGATYSLFAIITGILLIFIELLPIMLCIIVAAVLIMSISIWVVSDNKSPKLNLMIFMTFVLFITPLMYLYCRFRNYMIILNTAFTGSILLVCFAVIFNQMTFNHTIHPHDVDWIIITIIVCWMMGSTFQIYKMRIDRVANYGTKNDDLYT